MDKCKDVLSHFKKAVFIEAVVPQAEYLGRLAYERFENKQFEDVAYFEPFYLKEFVSQSEFHKKK